jgi:hypothetical protein
MIAPREIGCEPGYFWNLMFLGVVGWAVLGMLPEVLEHSDTMKVVRIIGLKGPCPLLRTFQSWHYWHLVRIILYIVECLVVSQSSIKLMP